LNWQLMNICYHPFCKTLIPKQWNWMEWRLQEKETDKNNEAIERRRFSRARNRTKKSTGKESKEEEQRSFHACLPFCVFVFCFSAFCY
jgi:hypothetical protein